jgi:hypothetical protein
MSFSTLALCRVTAYQRCWASCTGIVLVQVFIHGIVLRTHAYKTNGKRELEIPSKTVAKGTFGTVERVKLSKFLKAKSAQIHTFFDPSTSSEETEINLAGTEDNI